jgi:hypothetical protein
MATNPNIQRLASNVPGFPELQVPAFELPSFPDEIKRRFPAIEVWTEQFNSRHREWEANLQHAVERALQSQKTIP